MPATKSSTTSSLHKKQSGLIALLSELQLEPLRGGIRRIEQLLPDVAALAHSPSLLAIAQHHLPRYTPTGAGDLFR
jgi:hypothetical protein